MTTSSSSFSYCHFASVKKTMNPTRHPLMLFCNCEKMTTNNYATHRHYGVVLQEQKNDNKQLCYTSSLWCSFARTKK